MVFAAFCTAPVTGWVTCCTAGGSAFVTGAVRFWPVVTIRSMGPGAAGRAGAVEPEPGGAAEAGAEPELAGAGAPTGTEAPGVVAAGLRTARRGCAAARRDRDAGRAAVRLGVAATTGAAAVRAAAGFAAGARSER
jgi:hypothetical protein